MLTFRADEPGAPRYRPISGQHLEPYAGMPYGNSTLGYSGCEAIAVYNFLLLLGRPVPLDRVARWFEERFEDPAHPLSGWGRHGRWGATPGDIAACLTEHGIACRSARTLRGMERLVTAPGALMISFWNKPAWYGYHTVALDFDGERFTGYNTDCGRPSAETRGTLAAFPAGWARFIRGFYAPYGGRPAGTGPEGSGRDRCGPGNDRG